MQTSQEYKSKYIVFANNFKISYACVKGSKPNTPTARPLVTLIFTSIAGTSYGKVPNIFYWKLVEVSGVARNLLWGVQIHNFVKKTSLILRF
jgi:hypothetical protein